MTVNGPVTSRRFWAYIQGPPPSNSSPDRGINRYLGYGIAALVALPFLVAIPVLAFAGFVTALQVFGGTFLLAVMVGGGGAALVVLHSSAPNQMRRIPIGVTNGALTVDERPGVAYSFLDAKLGTWGTTGGMTTGAALHLQSGIYRFILGGRDHRLSAGTPLGAPDVDGLSLNVDAWVSASDFDEILDMTGLRNRLGVRQPAPGTPIRCVLFPNATLLSNMGPLSMGKTISLSQSLNQPRLAIDVGAETIWVMDPYSNALIGSAWRAQVTATPTTYEPSFGSPAYRYRDMTMAPEMVVSCPSLPPLTIACLDVNVYRATASRGGIARRFSWRVDVQVVDDPAEYSVSGADWLTLVEAFGLAPYLAECVSHS